MLAGKAKARLGLLARVLSGKMQASAARRRAVGLITAGSILNFQYFGSRAVPIRCSDPESRS